MCESMSMPRHIPSREALLPDRRDTCSLRRCCRKPRKGATPVPAPIMTSGVVESYGGWKEGLRRRKTAMRYRFDPASIVVPGIAVSAETASVDVDDRSAEGSGRSPLEMARPSSQFEQTPCTTRF